VSTSSRQNQRQVLGFLGVGLDGKDGHQRVTRNEHFLLVGGSTETHEALQEVSIKFNESLEDRGKRLEDASIAEVIDLLHQAIDD